MLKKKMFKTYFSDENDCNLNKTRFIHNRVKLVEKFIPELGKAIFEYIDKSAKSRDCCDKIALILNDYGKSENVTLAFKSQVEDFANILLDVSTNRDVKIRDVEKNVIEQLRDYEKLCKIVQTDLKLSEVAGDKERTCVRQLKRMKDGFPQDQEQISVAEAECLKAKGESARLSKNLEEQVDNFERKRLSTIKNALLSWTLTELNFHTKALQLFTEAYRIANDIDVNMDLEEFRNKLRSTEDSPRCEPLSRTESFLQLISLPFHKKTKFTGNGIPHPASTRSSLQTLSNSVSENSLYTLKSS